MVKRINKECVFVFCSSKFCFQFKFFCFALSVKLQVKSECDELSVDIDDGIIKMERYIKALEVEIKERTSLIDLLEASESYYETQRGEAKIVCNAYRNFGSRVKSLKRKLADLILTLPSPLPSPDVNAPSPSPESDIDLPDDNNGNNLFEFYPKEW